MVAASPVVPQMTRASVPFSSRKSRCFPRAGKSTPRPVKGVVTAAAEPVKIGFFTVGVLLYMVRLLLFYRNNLCSIIRIGA